MAKTELIYFWLKTSNKLTTNVGQISQKHICKLKNELSLQSSDSE